VTQITVSSDADMASDAEGALCAPLLISDFAFVAVRFQTVTLWPALSRASANADPIKPRPITLTSRAIVELLIA
jgi:hypothetical protein